MPITGNPEVTALVLFIMGLGFCLGSHDAFLFLHVKNLHGSDIFLGLSLFMNCVIEVPAIYFADMYLKKFGYINCLYLSAVVYSIRY